MLLSSRERARAGKFSVALNKKRAPDFSPALVFNSIAVLYHSHGINRNLTRFV